MPYQPYTKQLIGPTVFTVNVTMRFVYMSMMGRSATASAVLANNQAPGAPVPGAVQLRNNEVLNFTGPDGGYLERITVTVPAGGIVDIAAEWN